MEQITSTRNNSRSPRSNTDRRYSARYLILVYSRTSACFDPLEIQRLASTQQAKCTIVRKSLRDSTSTYFAFVDFVGKRFQTRNLRFFDIQGYHPKWLHLTSSPWRSLDQMMERGEIVWNGVSRPREPAGPRETVSSSKKPSSSSMNMKWELLGSSSNEESFLDLCKNQMPQETFDNFTGMLEQHEQSRHGETEMSRNVRYWQDGYWAGYEAGFSVTKSQTNDPAPASDTFDDADLAYRSQLGDDSRKPSLLHQDESPHSLFATVDRITGDLPQLDWESFELGDPNIDLT